MLRSTRYAACITMYSSTLQKGIEVTLSYNYNIVIHAAYQKGFDHAVHCSFPETIGAALYTPANTHRTARHTHVFCIKRAAQWCAGGLVVRRIQCLRALQVARVRRS